MNISPGLGSKAGMSFDEYEKKLLADKTSQMFALEIYKNLIDHFGWSNYSVVDKWNTAPSLMVKDIGNVDIEFAYGGDKIRILFCRATFVVPVDDKHTNAIQKIIDIFDYVESDDGAEKEL